MKLVKSLATALLVTITFSALTGCIVETGHSHRHHRAGVIVIR
jgi:hypothetical protein